MSDQSDRACPLIADFIKEAWKRDVTVQFDGGSSILTFIDGKPASEEDALCNISALAYYCGLNEPRNLTDQLAAERFAIWLALAPILHDMAELNRDNDDGHVTGFEVSLFLQRLNARLEAIGQGLHRFDFDLDGQQVRP